MKRVVSTQQAKAQDAAYDGDLGAIMDQAGYAVAQAAAASGVGYGTTVAVLAGTGNNGGDGYVAARYLARRGAAVTVHALGPPQTPEAIAAAELWKGAGGQTHNLDEVRRADLVIDAVFGVGFRGELPKELVAWEDTTAPRIAVDLVSGLDATSGDVAVGTYPAVETVALSSIKLGHLLGEGPAVSGRVTLAALDLPEPDASAQVCESGDAPRPDRPRDAHKWSAGAVAVVGGSRGMTGAAVLAAKSALRFGAGAVAMFAPGGLADAIDAAHPEIMVRAVGTGDGFAAADAGELTGQLDRFDALVVGPGLGQDVGAGFVDRIARTHARAVVLDADAIGAVEPGSLERDNLVVTPHGGEFATLAGKAPSLAAAADFAAAAGCVVLLKGPTTIVAAPNSLPWLVTSGGRELATVGSGDVLAGMIGALAARGLPIAVAARSAAHWHGIAGAHAARRGSVTAELLADSVGRYAFAPIVD